jgi:MraZ protein
MKKLEQLPVGQSNTRGIARFILAGAVEIEVDAAGRVLVPEYLKDFAGLGNSVVLAGVADRIEVWAEDVWQQYKAKIEKGAEDMAQTLGDLGML